MRMTLRYVHEYRDRHGHIRRYFRRPGQRKSALPGQPGSPEFMAAYQAALAQKARPIGEARNAQGSVASWVSLYLASAAFGSLATDTRRTRKNLLERFRAQHGNKPAGMLTTAHLEAIVSKHSPVVARNFLKALRPWMAWCVKQQLRQDNPAAAVERPAYKTDGYKPWQQEHVDAYRARWPMGTRERLALELLVNTGAARADITRLGRQHVRDGIVSFRRHKTGVLVEIPMLDELAETIASTQLDALTFLVAHGKPFTDAGFGNWFRECCNAAGVPVGYSAHGVRKYAATLRANLGATAHELMAWFGWLTIREAERYTRDAERRRLAVGLGDRVNKEMATRRKGSQTGAING